MILYKQKIKDHEGKNKDNWVIVIPPEDIEKLGWMEGMKLSGIVKLPSTYVLVPSI